MLCFTLLACSNNYERDTKAGSIEALSYEQFKQKMKDKDNMVVVVSQTECGHCKRYKTALEKYLENHHITVYEINLAIQQENVYEMFEIFGKEIKKFGDDDVVEFQGTPYTMIIEEGRTQDAYSGAFTYEDENHEDWDFTMDEFEEIVTQYRLDEKH